MFGEVAARYDLLNHLLSAGPIATGDGGRPPCSAGQGPVLDVCTGTADLALAYWRRGRGQVRVVGADFCRPMLAIGRESVAARGASRLLEADALRLPFADDTFQTVSVAFGLPERQRHRPRTV